MAVALARAIFVCSVFSFCLATSPFGNVVNVGQECRDTCAHQYPTATQYTVSIKKKNVCERNYSCNLALRPRKGKLLLYTCGCGNSSGHDLCSSWNVTSRSSIFQMLLTLSIWVVSSWETLCCDKNRT